METDWEVKKKYKSGRRWVFVYNNPIMDSEQLMTFMKGVEHLRYITFQLEKGEDTGTVHFQGYMEFNQPIRRVTLNNRLKMWYNPARGTPKQCIAYCSKSETRIGIPNTWGKSIRQGERHKLIAFKERISEGVNARQMLEEYPIFMAIYPKFYRTCSELLFKHFEDDTKQVILCIGDSRSGKTTWARKQDPHSYWLNPIGSGKWFDGYDKQRTVIFDDYGGDGTVYKLNDLLRLTHTWTESVQIKGAFVPWKPHTVIFTTNYHPRTWYDLTPDREKRYHNREISYKALVKRFTSVLYFTEKSDEPREVADIEAFFYDENYLYQVDMCLMNEGVYPWDPDNPYIRDETVLKERTKLEDDVDMLDLAMNSTFLNED